MKHKSLRFAWIVFCNLIVVTTISQRTKTDAAVQPGFDDDGNINWGHFDPISKSNLYSSFDDIKKPDIILDMSQGFVDFVVHGLPYETITDILKDLQDDGNIDDTKATTGEIVKGFIGVVILVLIGMLLFILVPFIGFCFCCCRCCGNCGGKREQVDSNLGCKRVTLSIIFVALMGIMGAGMAFTNSANDFQRDSLDRSDETFNSLSDAALNYTKEVLKQVEFMVDIQYDFADAQIRVSLMENTLAKDVTDYIKEDLKLQEVTDDLDKISTDLESVKTSFNNINDDRTELIEEEKVLRHNLSSIEETLGDIDSTCSSCDLPAFESQIEGNFSSLPEVSQDQIDNVQDGIDTVDGVNQEIDDSLQEIETTINDETNQTVYEIIVELDNIQTLLDENFQDVEDAINKATDAVKEAQDSYKQNLGDIELWLNYRWWFFLGISCSILFVLILMILGFTMGTICYTKGSPRERSCMSNAGGNCLMLTVFSMFVLFPILILLTCLMFAIFSLATATCMPLETLEFYKETVDKPDVIVEGYFLGHVIYDNGSYEVTISGALEACREDDTLYNAIKLDYLIDFAELEKEFDKIEENLDNFVGDIEDVPLNFTEIIPVNLKAQLDDLVSDVGINDFDAESYQNLLPESILKEPDYLTTYAEMLDEIADTSGLSLAVKAELKTVADDLRTLQTTLVDPMTLSVGYITGNISLVEDVNGTLPSTIESAIDAAGEVEAAVSSVNETAIAINLTEIYVKELIGIGESYFNQMKSQIENDFAKCYNIWDMYSVTLLYTCDYLLNSGNALWFTIGWAVFFFLPSIIFSVKLAKHYRIMNKVRPPKPKKQNNRTEEDGVVMNEMNGYHGNNGYDEMLMYQERQRGGMTPVDNPQFIPDEGPIMAYGYDMKGNPIAPPPAYNYGEEFRTPPHNSYF